MGIFDEFTSFLSSKYDALQNGMLNQVLKNVGVMIRDGAKDPDMPEWLINATDVAHETVWHAALHCMADCCG